MSEYVLYGYVGTNTIIKANSWNPVNGAIIVNEPYPGLPYILGEDGEWHIPESPSEKEYINARIREKRKQEILAKWKVNDQMEALTESAMGDDTKLNQLKQDISTIKLNLPKV